MNTSQPHRIASRIWGLLAALAVTGAVSVSTALPAVANGNTVVGMPNAATSSTTCGGSGYANWELLNPEGVVSIEFGGSTTCNQAVTVSGTADLIPNGGSTPVRTKSFPSKLTTSGSVRAFYTTVPGSVFAIRYTTTIATTNLTTWTTVPPQCTVDPGSQGKKITCSMITFFTVN